RRDVSHRESRARAGRFWNASCIRSHLFSARLTRSSCCRMGRKLLVVAQEIFPLTTGAIPTTVTNERIVRELSRCELMGAFLHSKRMAGIDCLGRRRNWLDGVLMKTV